MKKTGFKTLAMHIALLVTAGIISLTGCKDDNETPASFFEPPDFQHSIVAHGQEGDILPQLYNSHRINPVQYPGF